MSGTYAKVKKLSQHHQAVIAVGSSLYYGANMATFSDSVANGLQPPSPSSSDSRDSGLLQMSEDEGWEDAEAEEEDQEVESLFTNEIFPNTRAMLEDCKAKHGFDLVKTTKELGVYVYRHFNL